MGKNPSVNKRQLIVSWFLSMLYIQTNGTPSFLYNILYGSSPDIFFFLRIQVTLVDMFPFPLEHLVS